MPDFVSRKLRPREAAPQETRDYRQQFSNGKVRIETLSERGGDPVTTLVYDGELFRRLNAAELRGSIFSGIGEFAPLGADYSTFFRAIDAADMVRDVFEKGKCSATPDATRGGLWLETTPSPALKYRVWLDPSHGMMPNTIEEWRVSDQFEPWIHCRIQVEAYHELVGGGWVPTKVVTRDYISLSPESRLREFGGQVNRETVAEVDIGQSKWNTPIPVDRFILSFPAGTEVIDEVLDRVYVAGESTDGSHLRRIALEARELAIPPPGASSSESLLRISSRWPTILLYIGIVVLGP